MTQEHPITPPPELVQVWARYATGYNIPGTVIKLIATQAARWGADHELEACCEWIYKLMDRGLEWSMDLRTARRRKPSSLKELALEALDEEHADMRIQNYKLIRSVLESLPS